MVWIGFNKSHTDACLSSGDSYIKVMFCLYVFSRGSFDFWNLCQCIWACTLCMDKALYECPLLLLLLFMTYNKIWSTWFTKDSISAMDLPMFEGIPKQKHSYMFHCKDLLAKTEAHQGTSEIFWFPQHNKSL